jgi:phage-related minor tail protein
MVMGGEYIMSPQTTAKYGTGFMGELNRGRLPGYQDGGFVGGAAMAAGGVTTNNVSLSISVGKDGKTNVDSESKSSQDSNSEREDKEDVEKSKQFGDAIRSAVLKEIQRQQRPGGMLRDGATYAGGRRP